MASRGRFAGAEGLASVAWVGTLPSDGAPGNRLEPVRLVDLGTVRGGLTVRPVVSPAFKPE